MEIIRAYIRERVIIEDCGHSTPCWCWSRCTRDGYGRADIIGRHLQAHRVSFEAFRGEIAAGFEIDHLCCVTNCVNPDHLEPVTPEENLRRKCQRRGLTIGGKPSLPHPPSSGRSIGWRGQLTHCSNGHEYSPDNTLKRPDGLRRCAACYRRNNANKIRRRSERRAAARLARMAGGIAGGSSSPSYTLAHSTHPDIARPGDGTGL